MQDALETTERRLRLSGSPSLSSSRIVLRQEEKEKKRKGEEEDRKWGRRGEDGKEGKKASMVQFSKITGTQMRDSIKGGALMGSGEQETQANTEVDGGFRVTAMHPSGPQGNLSRQSRRMET